MFAITPAPVRGSQQKHQVAFRAACKRGHTPWASHGPTSLFRPQPCPQTSGHDPSNRQGHIAMLDALERR